MDNTLEQLVHCLKTSPEGMEIVWGRSEDQETVSDENDDQISLSKYVDPNFKHQTQNPSKDIPTTNILVRAVNVKSDGKSFTLIVKKIPPPEDKKKDKPEKGKGRKKKKEIDYYKDDDSEPEDDQPKIAKAPVQIKRTTPDSDEEENQTTSQNKSDEPQQKKYKRLIKNNASDTLPEIDEDEELFGENSDREDVSPDINNEEEQDPKPSNSNDEPLQIVSIVTNTVIPQANVTSNISNNKNKNEENIRFIPPPVKIGPFAPSYIEDETEYYYLCGDLAKEITTPVIEFLIKIKPLGESNQSDSDNNAKGRYYILCEILDCNIPPITPRTIKFYAKESNYFNNSVKVGAAGIPTYASHKTVWGRKAISQCVSREFKSLTDRLRNIDIITAENIFNRVSSNEIARHVIHNVLKDKKYFEVLSVFGAKIIPKLDSIEYNLLLEDPCPANSKRKTELLEKVCSLTDSNLNYDRHGSFFVNKFANTFPNTPSSRLGITMSSESIRDDGSNMGSFGSDNEDPFKDRNDDITNNKQAVLNILESYKIINRFKSYQKLYGSPCIHKRNNEIWSDEVIQCIIDNKHEALHVHKELKQTNTFKLTTVTQQQQQQNYSITITSKSLWDMQSNIIKLLLLNNSFKVKLFESYVDDGDLSNDLVKKERSRELDQIMKGLMEKARKEKEKRDIFAKKKNNGESDSDSDDGSDSHDEEEEEEDKSEPYSGYFSSMTINSNHKFNIICTPLERRTFIIKDNIKCNFKRVVCSLNDLATLLHNTNLNQYTGDVALFIDRSHLLGIKEMNNLLTLAEGKIAYLYFYGSLVGKSFNIGTPFHDIWYCTNLPTESLSLANIFIRREKIHREFNNGINEFLMNFTGSDNSNELNNWDLIVKDKKVKNMVYYRFNYIYSSACPPSPSPLLNKPQEKRVKLNIRLLSELDCRSYIEKMAICCEGMSIVDIQRCIDCSSTKAKSMVIIAPESTSNFDICNLYYKEKAEVHRESCFNEVYSDLQLQSLFRNI